MQFSELAEKRFSVRKFTGDSVPDEIIKKILKAGYVAPAGCNNQPQRILVLNTEESTNKLRKCIKCHFDAPTAMLICYNKDECWYRPYDGAPCGQVDASIVTTHMMMEATELGIETTWVMHFDPEAMRREFLIPENYEMVALLVMGYAAEDAKPFSGHSEYRPEDEVIYYNHFNFCNINANESRATYCRGFGFENGKIFLNVRECLANPCIMGFFKNILFGVLSHKKASKKI